MVKAHFLLTLTLVCGSGAFWAEGNRLFSADNNYRNEVNSIAPIEVVPSDWKTDPYWGAWLVGEWVGLLITGICVVRSSQIVLPLNHLPLSPDCLLHHFSLFYQ